VLGREREKERQKEREPGCTCMHCTNDRISISVCRSVARCNVSTQQQQSERRAAVTAALDERQADRTRDSKLQVSTVGLVSVNTLLTVKIAGSYL